ncbi:MAG: HD family phosphohydrolase [Bacillota bacterium]
MGLLDKIKEKFEWEELQFTQKDNFKYWVWGVVVFIVLTLILTIDFIPNQVDLEVGQVSSEDIIAPETIEYIDQVKTEKLKDQAAKSVSKVYVEQADVLPEVKEKLSNFFAMIREYNGITSDSSKEELATAQKIKEIKSQTKVGVGNEVIKRLLEVDQDTLSYIEEKSNNLVVKYLSRGVRSDDLEEVKEQIADDVAELSAAKRYKYVIDKVAQNVIKPNLILNQEETTRRKKEARQSVDPVKHTIREGEVIIRHGKVITEQDLRILNKLGLRHKQIDLLVILGLALIVIIFEVSTIIYLVQYQSEIIEDEGIIALLGILPILTLLLAKIITFFPLDHPSYLVPVAGMSMLLTILVNYNLAIIVTIAISFLISLVTGSGISGLAVLLVGGLAGVYSVSKVSQRSDLVRAGFYVSGVSAVVILAFDLSTAPVKWFKTLELLSLGVINGVIAAIITNGFLPYLENTFGITSAVKLLELSNPNQPLLKKLLVEAPGTYHHSVIVGNLAEAAADEVGADSLFVRVGAYYHDIGKIKRPYFFSENQFGSENPHNKLSPTLSTLIITSHVKDGLELAKKYGLPNRIIDIIKQHHGTSLISFFYQEAIHDEKYENIDETEFRYKGPKPQSKEAALIMLADLVEAAVRSKIEVQSNPDKMEALVRELIRSKLDDGQLDESDLTLKDLSKITDAFVNVLSGIFHNRVEYPENLAQEMKEAGDLNGNSD